MKRYAGASLPKLPQTANSKTELSVTNRNLSGCDRLHQRCVSLFVIVTNARWHVNIVWRWREILTISVSETGPKLVTKMLVLISVTFSVRRDRKHKPFTICSYVQQHLFYRGRFNVGFVLWSRSNGKSVDGKKHQNQYSCGVSLYILI